MGILYLAFINLILFFIIVFILIVAMFGIFKIVLFAHLADEFENILKEIEDV